MSSWREGGCRASSRRPFPLHIQGPGQNTSCLRVAGNEPVHCALSVMASLSQLYESKLRKALDDCSDTEAHRLLLNMSSGKSHKQARGALIRGSTTSRSRVPPACVLLALHGMRTAFKTTCTACCSHNMIVARRSANGSADWHREVTS